jgi:hypothetical protein
MTKARPVVVLVHGTWDQDAKWTADDSPLCSQLREHLAAVFERSPWTGLNSHTDRLAAATDLRKRLQDIRSRNPGSPLFVVAHSHGGNIACYALQDKEMQSAVRGVICLATPFLHVRPSALPKSLLAAVIPTLVIFWLVGFLYLFFAPQDAVTTILVVTVVLLTAAVLSPLLWGLLRRRKNRLRWGDLIGPARDPVGFSQRLSLPDLGAKLLVVRLSGDEASAALIASHVFVWLVRRTWSIANPIWNLWDSARRKLATLVGMALLVAALAGWLTPGGSEITGLVSAIGVGLLGLFGLVAVVVGLISSLLLSVCLLMHAAVGVDAMLASLELLTTTETTPPGRGEVATIQFVATDDSSRNGTRSHSLVVKDNQVIDAVANWMHKRLQEQT